MTYQQPPQGPGGQYPGQPYYPPPQPPKKSNTGKIIAGIAIGIVVLCGLGIIFAAVGGNSSDKTSATSTTQPLVATSTTVEVPTSITMPTSAAPTMLTIPGDLIGMNGQLAYEKLKDLGFTSIMPASGDPDDKVPLLLTNWKVTEVEPGAGTKVKSNSTIVLTMVKK